MTATGTTPTAMIRLEPTSWLNLAWFHAVTKFSQEISDGRLKPGTC